LPVIQAQSWRTAGIGVRFEAPPPRQAWLSA
jgi:hypothetical protein